MPESEKGKETAHIVLGGKGGPGQGSGERKRAKNGGSEGEG